MNINQSFAALTLTKQGGLGTFRKLPPELRIMVWKELFKSIEQLQGPRSDPTPGSNESIISIMACSQDLYEEVGELLFNNFNHEIEIPTASDGPAWFINLSARYLKSQQNKMGHSE
ncbi:hypothetical protein N7466_010522 [Penicillium verhagenii]|uniref:uncharacterized protein n=1 Tax=Penicillium verhagenii TaxID=1562060 RepID=UPI002544E18F|nr:uncharacterized protein N7466_010522 [Penicillium verhagenii]KAJ5918530.1 hypothetical protein N7466_010522 [Penicillium verhagenii]